MKKLSTIVMLALIPAIFILPNCNQNKQEENQVKKDTTAVANVSYGGFESQVKWGGHIVTIADCGNCHTPKKMTATGPEPDMSLALSGHPANMPPPDVNRKEMESKGLFASNDLTSWVGPWGISYSANITSDTTTGIGNWTEDQFILCLHKGKYMGLERSRDLLPPMPWQAFRNMTDDELKAVFAYLKSTKPIHNIVPQAAPPVLARKN